MQYSQEHLKTMVYTEFGGANRVFMGNWKIENTSSRGLFIFALGSKPPASPSLTTRN